MLWKSKSIRYAQGLYFGEYGSSGISFLFGRIPIDGISHSFNIEPCRELFLCSFHFLQ
jgi:hypothetical protein